MRAVASYVGKAHAERVRRLIALVALGLAVLAVSTGSVPAAQAGARQGPVLVVHTEMRCHSVSDHVPIG